MRLSLCLVVFAACQPIVEKPPAAPPAAPTETKPVETPQDLGPAPTVISVVPAAGATNVPTNATIVIVFSEPIAKASAQDNVLVTGGAQGLVAGTLNVSTRTLTFKPDAALQTSTSYTVVATTGLKTEKGAALAASFTFTFTTGEVADTTPPVINATSPAAGATNVPTNTQISFVFNEPLTPASATPQSVSCVGIAGTVSAQGSTVVFKPAAPLQPSTQTTCVVTTGVTDTAGNALAAAYTLSFTTGAGADNTAPTVIATSPLDSSSNVSTGATITATFSEPIDPVTLSSATFTLSDGATQIAGTVTAQGATASFKPVQPLVASTVYTATLAATVKDLAGNALSAPFGWVFTTSGGNTDTTPPHVLTVSPANNAMSVATNTAIVAQLDEAIDPATVSGLTVSLTKGGQGVAFSVQASGQTITLTPLAALASSSKYDVALAAAITDMSGNALGTTYTWSFTTGSGSNTTPPTLTQSTPANGATGVSPSTVVTLVFSEALEPATIASLTFSPGTVAITQPQPNVIELTPSATLAHATLHTVTIIGVTDLAGNAIAATTVSFTTQTAATSWPGTITLGSAGDTAHAITTDASGNLFIAFSTSVAFAGDPIGGRDNAVVKLDSFGNVLWSRRYGTTGDDKIVDIGVDAAGDVYLYGSVENAWEGSVPTVFSQLTLTKYSAAGVQLFYREFGGWASNDYAGGMAIDGSGLVYLTAATDYIISIWDENQGGADLSLYKYNSLGERQWSMQLGSAGNDYGDCVSISPGGTVFVSGVTNGALFGTAPSGGYDAFVATVNPSSGAATWSSMIGTSGDEDRGCVAVSSSRIFVFGITTGAFAGAADPDGDAFAIALQTNGTEAWRAQLHTEARDRSASGVASGSDLYMAGVTGGRLIPGGTTADDAFLSRLSSATPAYTAQLGGAGNEYGRDVTLSGAHALLLGDGPNGVFIEKYDANGVLQ